MLSSRYLTLITCKVDNLPGRSNTLHHDQEDDDPGAHEAEKGPVLDAAKGVDTVGAVKDAPEPKKN